MLYNLNTSNEMLLFSKGALAIRRIFSLLDKIAHIKFSNCLKVFKLVWFGKKMCVVTYKICFKAIHHLQSHENLQFLLPPFILRLYTRHRLDRTLVNALLVFKK